VTAFRSDLAHDYLGLDGLLSADELAWRDRVRGFVSVQGSFGGAS
jgi:hypothetical protein